MKTLFGIVFLPTGEIVEAKRHIKENKGRVKNQLRKTDVSQMQTLTHVINDHFQELAWNAKVKGVPSKVWSSCGVCLTA